MVPELNPIEHLQEILKRVRRVSILQHHRENTKWGNIFRKTGRTLETPRSTEAACGSPTPH